MKSKNFQTNQIKEYLTATLRALVADESVQVEFEDDIKNNFFTWNQNLVLDEKIVAVPQIQVDEIFSEENLVKRFRAASDLAASYLLFHDKKLHKNENIDEEEQKFFDEFERVRVIANVRNSYRGAAKNILAKVEDDIFSGSTNLSLILLNKIFDAEILPRSKEVALDLEKNLDKKIIKEIKNLAQKELKVFPMIFNNGTFIGSFIETQEFLDKQLSFDENAGF